jgi:cyclin-A
MDILDIDKDIGNPLMCASYVVEIYSNLMASEVFLLKEMFRSSII